MRDLGARPRLSTLPLPSSAPRATAVVMDHSALTTARHILTVLGIDLDQVRSEPCPLREVLDAYIADLAAPTNCVRVRARGCVAPVALREVAAVIECKKAALAEGGDKMVRVACSRESCETHLHY